MRDRLEPGHRPGALPGKPQAVALIALAQVLALALWFAATAVAPDLVAQKGLEPTDLSRLALAVQLGFVAGSLLSAFLGLADRFEPRALFAAGALLGALANAVFLVVEPASAAALASRALVGAAMAAVYPVGIKMAASWAKGDAGLLVGLLVGALTLGSAAPHGFAAFGGVDWRLGVGAASLCAVSAAGVIAFAKPGPGWTQAGRFKPVMALALVRSPAPRLATLGYLGHMWELYAGWAWIGVWFSMSFSAQIFDSAIDFWAKLATFGVIGVGALGCVAAGGLADRFGRTAVTMAAMGVSGLMCLAFGLVYGGPVIWVLLVGAIWGVTVIADSAQFSAAVAELSPKDRVGAFLTLQTALGFALTAVSIRLLPVWAEMVGWRWALAPLAIGPALGVLAMARLRARPEAVQLAGGRR
ncbi:MAG: MFS transporter [Maricaulaceae bacterium]